MLLEQIKAYTLKSNGDGEPDQDRTRTRTQKKIGDHVCDPSCQELCEQKQDQLRDQKADQIRLRLDLVERMKTYILQRAAEG